MEMEKKHRSVTFMNEKKNNNSKNFIQFSDGSKKRFVARVNAGAEHKLLRK